MPAKPAAPKDASAAAVVPPLDVTRSRRTDGGSDDSAASGGPGQRAQGKLARLLGRQADLPGRRRSALPGTGTHKPGRCPTARSRHPAPRRPPRRRRPRWPTGWPRVRGLPDRRHPGRPGRSCPRPPGPACSACSAPAAERLLRRAQPAGQGIGADAGRHAYHKRVRTQPLTRGRHNVFHVLWLDREHPDAAPRQGPSAAVAVVMPRARHEACASSFMSMTWMLPAGHALPASPEARAAAILPPPMNAIESSFFIMGGL